MGCAEGEEDRRYRQVLASEGDGVTVVRGGIRRCWNLSCCERSELECVE